MAEGKHRQRWRKNETKVLKVVEEGWRVIDERKTENREAETSLNMIPTMFKLSSMWLTLGHQHLCMQEQSTICIPQQPISSMHLQGPGKTWHHPQRFLHGYACLKKPNQTIHSVVLKPGLNGASGRNVCPSESGWKLGWTLLSAELLGIPPSHDNFLAFILLGNRDSCSRLSHYLATSEGGSVIK